MSVFVVKLQALRSLHCCILDRHFHQQAMHLSTSIESMQLTNQRCNHHPTCRSCVRTLCSSCLWLRGCALELACCLVGSQGHCLHDSTSFAACCGLCSSRTWGRLRGNTGCSCCRNWSKLQHKQQVSAEEYDSVDTMMHGVFDQSAGSGLVCNVVSLSAGSGLV